MQASARYRLDLAAKPGQEPSEVDVQSRLVPARIAYKALFEGDLYLFTPASYLVLLLPVTIFFLTAGLLMWYKCIR